MEQRLASRHGDGGMSEITLDNAILYFSTAEGAAREVKKILLQIRECLMALNWVEEGGKRERIEAKVAALMDEYDTVLARTKLKGQELFVIHMLEELS